MATETKNMRKQFCRILTFGIIPILMILLAALPSPGALAGQYLDFKYSDDGTNVTLTGYTGIGGSVVIPESIGGLPVTSIGERLFEDLSSMTNVTIPNSVNQIGENAFNNCINLKSVAIPNGVTSIEAGTFNFCTGLTNILIGNSVTNIGVGAFLYCTNIVNITIPTSVIDIQYLAFSRCFNLANVSIPNSVVSIGFHAFDSCTNLTSIRFPASMIQLGSWPFYRSTNLTNITVDPQNTAYCSVDGVMLSRDQTMLVQVPGGRAGDYVVPNSVTTIGNGSLNSCVNLTRIVIPNGVTNISGSFDDCIGLTNISVDPLNTVYSSVEGVLFNKNQTVLIQYPRGRAGDYVVPNSATAIGSFNNSINLTRIVIPNSVINISGAFTGCASLTNIDVDPLNAVYSSVDGVLFNKNQTVLIQFPGGKSGNYLIPSSVNTIGESAFSQCTGLASVTIPESINLIKNWAFYSCSNLTNITFPNRFINIKDWAFADCTSLTRFDIPDKISYLSLGMFDGWLDLIYISIGKGMKRISGYDLFYFPKLTNIDVNPLNSVCSSVDGVLFNKEQTSFIKYPGGKPGHFVIPNTVTNIDNAAFYLCPTLTSVTIPNSVTAIGAQAF